MQLETIIGLEIHVQLKTKSKMFCGCSNDGENQPPNTTVCEVCLGHPGVLPVPNKQAVDWAIKTALALNCRINTRQNFDRKNYFYPDLPKGYQITQLVSPIGLDGYLEFRAPTRPNTLTNTNETGQNENTNHKVRVGINRLHLEEDAAKNFHAGGKIRVDYNRGGTPLMEIVTEPEFRAPAQAKAFLQELRLIMRYLEVSEADMEKGHLRCDANISLRPIGETKFYLKTEIKNLNSFKAVERALEYETRRQTQLWQAGLQPLEQSTRGWDEVKQITLEQRTKESSEDYRYFPEPDLPPFHAVSGETNTNEKINEKSFDQEKIRQDITELPADKRNRLVEEYDLAPATAALLVEERGLGSYFEKTMSEAYAWLVSLEEGGEDEIIKSHRRKLARLVSNWLVNKLGTLVAEKNSRWGELKITPENFAEFIAMIHQSKVSSTGAQKILTRMFETGEDPSQILADEALEQVHDTDELEKAVAKAIKDNPDEVMRYRMGKTALLKFFLGAVMRETKGRANPAIVEELLVQHLAK